MAADDVTEVARKGALEMRVWFNAYRDAGFTHQDAMALITRSVVQVTSQWPPEMMEAIERQSAFLTKMLSEMERD